MDIFNTFKEGNNILLHGPSGTGKTYTMNELINLIKIEGMPDEYMIGAPTGMAAILINGSTIHSLFGIGVYSIPNSLLNNLDSIISEYDPLVKYTEEDGQLYDLRCFISRVSSKSYFNDKTLKYLFVDEISMTGAVLLLIIDNILRKINPTTKNLPMGGVQCVFSGDFFQLPPVKDEFCCFTKLWGQMNITTINMEESKRYIGDNSNKHFDFICRLRKAKLTKADINLLYERRLAYNNESYKSLLIEPLILCATNDKIDNINNRKLAAINEREYVFDAIDTKNIFRSGLDAQQIKNCEINMNRVLDDIMQKSIKLKVGSQIIFTTNYEASKKLVNGRMCKVMEINELTDPFANQPDDCDYDLLDITLSNNALLDKPVKSVKRVDGATSSYEIVVCDVGGNTHKIRPISRSNQTKRFTCSRLQFPFKLAWAISIHRSQGLTLDSAKIDISNVFCSGQSYVAISRVSSIDNIFISELNTKKIYANKKISAMFG